MIHGLSTKLLRAVCVLLLTLTMMVSVVAAQEDGAPDYSEWADTSARVERVLSAGRADEDTLVQLREDVADWRDAFLVAESLNENRIDRINRQIASLGVAPAEGESEPDEVAVRRAELSTELSALQVPVLRASEAYVAADGLIREIDTTLRDMQAQLVFKRLSTPVNLLIWAEPLLDLQTLVTGLPREVATSLETEEGRKQLLVNLPGSGVLLLIGLYLLARSSYWSERLSRKLDDLNPRLMRKLLQVLVNLLQLALPYTGLVACLAAIQNTGVFGTMGEDVLFSLSIFGLVCVLGLWLVKRMFPRGEDVENVFGLESDAARRAKILTQVIVLMLATFMAVSWLSEARAFSELSRGLLIYTIASTLAYFLFRLARLFRYKPDTSVDDEEDERGFAQGVVSALARLAMLFCVAGVGVGLFGYYALSEKLIIPAVLTFFLFGFLVLVQTAATELYALVSKFGQSREDSLLPTLFGAFLILLSMPVLALIWGARVTDLTEFWAKIREGFSVGDIRISPTETLAFFIIFALGYALTRLVQTALRTTILPKTRLDQGARTALISGAGYIGIFLAALVAITTAGIDLSSLAIFASALAVGVGFGLQTIVSNFVSGIILLVERPVSEGDWIEVGGQMGYVRRISVRATRIETFDRTDVIVPNADLVSGQVTNWTRGNLIGRVIVPVGVAYGTDTRKVERLLQGVAEAHPMVVLSPPPSVVFMGFGESSLDFEIRAILRDINFMLSAKSDMNHEIVRIFEDEGIEIPFAQRDLWLRNPEVLQPVTTRNPAQNPVSPREDAPKASPAVTMTSEDMDTSAGDGDNT